MKVRKIGRLAAGALAIAMVASCTTERSGTAMIQGGGADGGGQAAASAGKFGTLASPCGPGDAKGATDQGITDDAITIGFGDDRGFASAPGLSKEMGDAVSAMIEWCNEQGGINGRKIKGNQYDAAYTQSAQVMQESCKQDFMLVGQGFAMDEAAEQYRVACKLPTVAGYTVGPNAAMGPMKYEAVPYPVDMLNVGGPVIAGKLFSDFKEKTDVLLSTSPAVTTGVNKVASALKGMGVEPMECGVRLNDAGESSYMPFAEKIKKCGVGYMWSSETPDPGQFSLLESVQRAGADPKYLLEATWYSTKVSEWNKGGAGDGIHVA
ncbi:hypothetical protein [Actinomadura sp. CNU-125]|uniref:hypothetical protein n=1 Tax=Actinomadura sp. CNU-125 TaxID=1904961 RepID=UPI000A437AE6|nr:hypothetical protein [Actinomadura sp. CNU-125]